MIFSSRCVTCLVVVCGELGLVFIMIYAHTWFCKHFYVKFVATK